MASEDDDDEDILERPCPSLDFNLMKKYTK